jgi:hypothetical protein
MIVGNISCRAKNKNEHRNQILKEFSYLHFVSEGPLIANVFEPSDACTLGFAK